MCEWSDTSVAWVFNPVVIEHKTTMIPCLFINSLFSILMLSGNGEMFLLQRENSVCFVQQVPGVGFSEEFVLCHIPARNYLHAVNMET